MKRARKRLTQSVALLLVSIFAFLYPLQVSAHNTSLPAGETQMSGTTELLDNDINQSYEEPPVIIAELNENRDQITKTFKLSNGNKMAVQYDYPVHYLDENDNWVEYDNRMTEIVDSSDAESETQISEQIIATEDLTEETETASVAETSQLIEDIMETEQSASVVSVDDETQLNATTGATETVAENEETATSIPNADETATDATSEAGQAEESTAQSNSSDEIIDNSTYYDNKSSDIDIKLSKKAKQNNMVKLSSDDYKITWGYEGANKSTVEFIENNEVLTGNDNFLTPKNVIQQAIYRNIYNGVDLECIVSSVGVKENIILNSSSAMNEFEIAYKVNGLTVSQINDNTVGFYNSSNEQVYSITAPYMKDANGEVSNSVTISIVEQKNKKITLKVTADKEWLENSDRVYPVTIDPSFTTSQSWQSTSCTYVDQSNPNKAYGYGSSTGYTGTIYVGTLGNGNFRSYIKVNDLPELNKGDIIVGAYLNLHLWQNDFYDDMYVGAYHVNNSWNQSTLTWNNQPQYNSAVYDYEVLDENISDNEPWRDWNVTTSVKRWYNGDANNGVMIKAVNESTNLQGAGFYSSNYPESTIPRAVFTIEYRNNKGLEDYWTYSGFNVGTAGQLYVNDYTGNLTFVHGDLGTAGNLMPVSVQHVFNNYMANEKYTKSKPYTGVGWKLNYQQTVLPSSQYGLTGDSASRFPYVYTDGDGTEHYFYKKTEKGTTKYLDEDGLGYELTIKNSSKVAKYTITDDKNNRMEFNEIGNLRKIISSNADTADSFYTLVDYDSDQKTIKQFKDGANKSVTFTTNEYNYITQLKNPAGQTMTYGYKENRLTSINNSNGTSVTFDYDSEGSITKITDIDGYKVEISYSPATSGKQVTAIQEYGTDGSAGQKITFDRSKYNQTVIQTSGVDGDYGTSDDVKTTYQFDQCGRTITVSNRTGTQDMGASVYKYTSGTVDSTASNIKYLNRVSSEYATASNTMNLIKNSSFESDSGWLTNNLNGGSNSTYTSVTEEKYIGQKSKKITTTSFSGDVKSGVYQGIGGSVLSAGKTYTLSAYVKTNGIASTAENYGAVACAIIENTNGSMECKYSEHIKGTTDTAVNNGWRRVSVTFTLPGSCKNLYVDFAIRAATGTAYFDAVQLEENTTANSYNMLQNGDMEYYSSSTGIPTYWYASSLTSNSSTDFISTSQKRSGNTSFMMTGKPNLTKEIYQTVPVSGSENDTYIVGGWAKADSVPENDEKNRRFKISVMVKFSDGTEVWKDAAEFNRSINDWQYSSATFNLSDGTSANKTPVSITVYLRYYRQCNKVYFDNIQLIKDATQSYTYNSDGKLVTVKENAQQQSTLEYSNSDLTKSVDPKGYAYKYDYDSKHNLTKATSQRGTTYNYTYDSKGNATALEAKNSDGNMSLKSTAEYTSNGAFLTKTTDQEGTATTYNYNQNSGLLMSAQDSSTTTSYTYDTNTNQLTSVTAQWDGLGEENVTNSYSYTAGTGRNLTQISHNGTDYNIEYDKFNNKTNTLVGNQSLAQYSYDSNNGILQSVTYGNGNTVSYTYDNYGNTSIQKYNGTTAFKWFSDRSGSVIRQSDFINQLETSYDYDTTGRLVRQTTLDTSKASSEDRTKYMVEYGYDLNNNITKLVNITPNGTKSFNYTYGKDNFLEKFTMGTNRSVNYAYDGLGRLTSSTITTARPIETSYLYKLSNRNSSGQTQYRTTKINNEVIDGEEYRYTYDASGNITKIESVTVENGNRVGTTLYTYDYDSFGQLTYDRDWNRNISNRYWYDEGGNLFQQDIAYYEGSSNGSPTRTETINYGYSDSNWTDKMTSYKGQTITYDVIGNPLSYRDGMTMTWQNGRQLASLQKGNNNIQYSYDSEGIRVSKTINGEKCTFEYLNGMLLYETRGEKYFHYYYDSNATLCAVNYRLTPNGTDYTYYYTHNWRGDIVGIYNGNGDLRAKYTYDSWGNVTSITDGNGNAITSSTHIGNLNPFRYRGYYMDTETGMYYLMSRYYDPVTHRFVNADGYFQTGTSITDVNMHAYCGNNPVNRTDPDGEFWGLVIAGAFIGGIISAGLEVADQLISGKDWSELDWGSVVIEGLSGIATGALVSMGLPAIKLTAAKASVNVATSLSHSLHAGEDFGTTVGKATLSCATTIGVEGLKATGRAFTRGNRYKTNKLGEITNNGIRFLSKPQKSWKQVPSAVGFGKSLSIAKKAVTKSFQKSRYKICSQCGCPHILIR